MGCWVIAGCVFALGHIGLYAQQSKIPWSSLSSGFSVMTSGSVVTASSVGQTAVGTTMNSGVRIESGFLADTTLRSLILAVKDEYGLPARYALAQNYPNPFNPVTTIQYQLPQASYVTLNIYNILGQLVATLVDGFEQAGYKSVKWNAVNVPSGVYFCRFQNFNFSETRKLLLVK